MKILYVIQTSDAYFLSRGKSTIDTWVKKIDPESDYVFLSANPIHEKVVGYGTRDDYFSLPEKWFHFIKNYNVGEFDWVFAIDDDLFCFPDRLKKYISENKFNQDEPISIGNKNCLFREINEDILCGGAGILISNSAIKLIKQFILNSELPIKYLCGDCNFHYWFESLKIEILNNSPNDRINGDFIPVYYKENHEISQKLDRCITLHYCKNEDKYELYKKFYE